MRQLTVKQAAGELNISVHTLRNWIAQRRIGHTRLGRAIRVPADEISRVLGAGFRAASGELSIGR
jgi:excisionase family DNA binding protein